MKEYATARFFTFGEWFVKILYSRLGLFMTIENVEKFIAEVSRSLDEGTFVKMILANYKGADAHLQKILARLIETRKGKRLFFLYRYDMRDTAKNYDFKEAVKILRACSGKDFFAGHLFTTENDFQLDIGKKGKSRLNVAKPTIKSKPTLDARPREKAFRQSEQFLFIRARHHDRQRRNPRQTAGQMEANQSFRRNAGESFRQIAAQR